MQKSILHFVTKITSIMAVLLMLNGCSTLLPSSPTATNFQHLTWQQRQQQLNAINNWRVQGSLGITYNNKTDITTFEWQHTPQNYLINIHSPMNLLSAQIYGSKNQVTLLQSSGKRSSAASPEELMYQQLGWALPITDLNYWIRSLPNKNVPSKLQFDRYNHLTSITQKKWQITYSDFQSVNNHIDLPTKIYITSPNQNLRAKIVIKKWLVY